MSRICHLSSAHDVHGTRVTYKECASLAAAGHDIALLNCYDGDIEVAGVQVIGLGVPRGRTDRILRKTWAIFFRTLREGADICHFHGPELVGVGLALRLCGKKAVYDVHEDVPLQVVNKTWIPGWLKKLLSGITRVLEDIPGRALSAIVAATPSIATKFPVHKTVVVQNFPERDLTDQRNDKPFRNRTNAFIYIGGLSEQQGLFEMFAAFEHLPGDVTGLLADKFKQLQEQAEAHPGWRHAHHPGPLPRDEVVAGLCDARIGLVLDHPISNYIEGYSTEMFEYMACSLPFIVSGFPLWKRIVVERDCGITVDPFDTDAVAKALNRLPENPKEAARIGENGRQAILHMYNWDIELRKFLSCYESLRPY